MPEEDKQKLKESKKNQVCMISQEELQHRPKQMIERIKDIKQLKVDGSAHYRIHYIENQINDTQIKIFIK